MPAGKSTRLLTALALALFMLLNAVLVASEPARIAADSHGTEHVHSHLHGADSHGTDNHGTDNDHKVTTDCHHHHSCHLHNPLATSLPGLFSALDTAAAWPAQQPLSHDSHRSQPPVPPPDHTRLS